MQLDKTQFYFDTIFILRKNRLGDTYDLSYFHRHQQYRNYLGPNSFEDEADYVDDLNTTYHKNIRHRNSGTGILEFSPAKAGRDVTPANFNFSISKGRKRSATVNSLAGL